MTRDAELHYTPQNLAVATFNLAVNRNFRREIHEATGISKNTLLLYEKGATPSIPQIEKIAKTYNVNPAWLAGWSDDDQQPQTIEKVVEKIVYVEKDIGRIPPYWNNNNAGKLIKWKERRRVV